MGKKIQLLKLKKKKKKERKKKGERSRLQGRERENGSICGGVFPGQVFVVVHPHLEDSPLDSNLLAELLH